MLGTREPGFGVNNFGGPLVYNESQSIAMQLVMVLLNRPGYMPSMPRMGMNIQEMLHSFYDEISEIALKAELEYQCPKFSQYVSDGVFSCQKIIINGQPGLLIAIPVTIESVSYRLVFNFRNTPEGEVVYDFYYDNNDDSAMYYQ